MDNINDLHKLIINNLAIIDKANELIPEIEAKIDDVINKKILAWLDSQENFSYNKNKSGEIHFYHNEWLKDDEEIAFFEYTYMEDDVINSISMLCKSVDKKDEYFSGLFWEFYYKNSNKYNTKSKWTRFLAEKFKEYENKPEFKNIEFYDSYLVAKFKVDPQELADNYPNTIEDALTSVDEALETIKQAYPIINKIYQAALE